MPFSIRRLAAVVPLVLTAGLLAVPPPPASAAYATIEGTGSTWSQLIVDQWIADVDTQGIKVVYTGGGSSKGRKDFAQGTVDYAVSEIPYQGTDETGQSDTSLGRDYAYVPLVAGGTAFTYQLKVGDQLVRNLRLSGRTLASIFTGAITSWNDPAITRDNNGRVFPDKAIIPVVRADGAGTTAQLTAWMDQEYPGIWRPYLGRSGSTSYYPRTGNMVAQSGSDQTMNTVAGFAGDGMIAYIEYSYPLTRNYPVVKVGNSAGYYVEPTQYNVAVALTKARIRSTDDPATDMTADLGDVYTNPDKRAYPLSSYSYAIIPTAADDARMTTAKRQSLADFLYYSLCSGQVKAGPYGYSPLPLNLVQAGFDQIARLQDADPAVDLTNGDVRSCNNPTFDGQHPDRNVLAQIAPVPPACDRDGAGPCGADGAAPGPPNPTVPVLQVRFGASRLASGVYVVNPRRHYPLTVRTTSAQRPRYLRPVARKAAFRGPGVSLEPAGRVGGTRVWTLRVQVKPGAGTRKIGVRVGRTTYVMLVRRA